MIERYVSRKVMSGLHEVGFWEMVLGPSPLTTSSVVRVPGGLQFIDDRTIDGAGKIRGRRRS